MTKVRIMISFFVILSFVTILVSPLRANVIVENHTSDTIHIGLLWTSIPSFNDGFINSSQWYSLGPGNYRTFGTGNFRFTECYWLAIKEQDGKSMSDVSSHDEVYLYTTFVFLPKNHAKIPNINDRSVATSIGSTALEGNWEEFFDRFSDRGYKLGKYKCWKFWYVPKGIITPDTPTKYKDIIIGITREDNKFKCSWKVR